MAFYKNLKYYRGDKSYPNKESWIASRLLTLRHDLHQSIKKDRLAESLIIGSWNIKAFDGGMPRLDESFHYIAEIIDHFDICAIQEIKKDLAPLERLVKLLGPNWKYFVSDVSVQKGGNSERMAFLYNKNRVFFKNLIGEVVLAKEDLIEGEQVARSPFFASFQAGWFRFSLCSAHIIFGNDVSKRAKEIGAVAKALNKRAKDEDQVHILLGDMNIKNSDDEVIKALEKSGMTVPDFGGTNMKEDSWYDRIVFTNEKGAKRKTKLLRHGKFDWRHAVFGPHLIETAPELTAEQKAAGISRLDLKQQLNHYKEIVDKHREKHSEEPYKNWGRSYRRWTTDQMSDHLPIWVELEVDYSDQYLQRFLEE